MSGHSKWSSIKHKKGAADAKRGQLFSKLSRAIIVAAKEGGADPSANLALQNAIEKARSYSMPKDNIERAIAKGSGADAEAASFETVVYEGYGPEGVAVLVEALTDNRNRTASEVRHAFTKHGGNLGTTGAVAWQFERRGVVLVAAGERCGRGRARPGRGRGRGRRRRARRIELRRDQRPRVADGRASGARGGGFAIESVELAMVPKTTVSVSDESTARRIVQARRRARGDGRRPGRLRELRHPRGGPRSGSLLGEPVAIAAADTAGRRADRIESLLSARLFVEPQLADDRITFISNLSGHLSLYAMDASGGVPEPLLPPQIALQNPELVGGHLVLRPRRPRPDPRDDRLGRRRELPPVHRSRSTAAFPSRSRSESVRRRPRRTSCTSTMRPQHRVLRRRVPRGVVDDGDPRRSRDGRSRRRCGRARTGAIVAAWTPTTRASLLVDGYTIGRSRPVRGRRAGERDACSTGRRSRSATPSRTYPLSGFRRRLTARRAAGRPPHDDALRRHRVARVPRPRAAGRRSTR